MLIWIIDEEWTEYEYEKEFLNEKYPGVEIKISTYDYQKDLEEFGYKADGILAQVYADIPAEVINKLDNCKVIATYGGGYDRIDIEACKNKGIRVTNIQGYCAEDLADYVIAAIYHYNKKINFYANNVLKDINDGKWGSTVIEKRNHRISKQKLFIVGFGTIGKAVAERAKLLGIEILAYDEYYNEEEIAKYGVKKVSWEEGFSTADYVSINLKGVEANRDKVGKNEFELMKKDAVIINTARGKIINEPDLVYAVKNGIIGGAILDVIDKEPPTGDEEILHVEGILVTPHISYISIESMRALKEFALGNLAAVLDNKEPRDPVV
ncbi:C-terminal binding protein [Peptoniphilus sp.]|jgi:lactate dehydrogenase-like 2-hydroxyacid dehydrogenase|uniref:C-terminal binding protein n=1 Tax=Peptoniphilus sp. TaxID=1971214 RepID=UPI003D8BB351